MLLGHLGGDVQKAVGNASLELQKEVTEMWLEMWVRRPLHRGQGRRRGCRGAPRKEESVGRREGTEDMFLRNKLI